ncbi:MAG: hypothetical protein JRI68_33825 [Deltaproteobacteria bacterium]|nr:hypothetical protein [Deltaproteobacteria bacterium]
MGLFSRVPFALGFVVTLVAVAALVLTPSTAAAQDKPWPKVHKPQRVRKPTPPASEPPATEEAKPSTTTQTAKPTPEAVVVKPPAALEAEAQRRGRANPFPGAAPEAAAPAGAATQVAGPGVPTMVTPEVVEPSESNPGASTLERHRAALAPYGTWVNEEGLGDLWLPEPAEVGADFAPYRTGGHWALTDQDQWAWVSDFDWGQAPFHYGRWDWNASRGWGWVPGTDWAPAWVLWRLGEPGFDYVGWAPVPPAKPGAGGTAEKTSTTPVLPFWYVPSAKLFHSNLNDQVITDRKLGRSAHEHSTIFSKHLAQAADVTKLTTAGLEAFRPASPSPTAARIPKAAIPKTRLKLTNPDQGREADDARARRGDGPRKRVKRGHSFGPRRLRSIGRGGQKRHPKLRHRVIQKKQIRPRPRQRCRRWVRTWSGALRCTHR